MSLNTGRSFVISFLFLASVIGSCTQNTSQSEEQKDVSNGNPRISFEKTSHDFKKIISGEKVAYAFRFTNTGNSPLVITGIRSGCGCTVGDYPKDPVRPGEGGRISVVFNSAGRRGFQSESVRVLNNSEESIVTLRIQAEVTDY